MRTLQPMLHLSAVYAFLALRSRTQVRFIDLKVSGSLQTSDGNYETIMNTLEYSEALRNSSHVSIMPAGIRLERSLKFHIQFMLLPADTVLSTHGYRTEMVLGTVWTCVRERGKKSICASIRKKTPNT
jgi:hypothetical protein